MMEEDAIIIQNVTKTFKLARPGIFKKTKSLEQNLMALDTISFTVKKGEMLTIIGSNGSGKTTLLRTIAGIYKPDSGKVQVSGKLAPILHLGTGFHFELNARENIISYGMLLGIKKSEIQQKISEILKFAGLEKFEFLKLKQYSTGMRARLAFATALQINPDIILIDEVLAVGDQNFRVKCFKEFFLFKNKGKTIVYTTHSLDRIYKLSDKVLLMDEGKMIAIGKPEEIKRKYEELMEDK